MSDQPNFNRKPLVKKPTAPKGHEAFLKALEQAGAVVNIQMTSGDTMKGTIKAADKYTVSLKVTSHDGSYQVYVVFKHAIEMFWTNPTIDAKIPA